MNNTNTETNQETASMEHEEGKAIPIYQGGEPGESDIQKYDLAVSRDPKLILEEAQKAAQALKAVIDKKPKKVIFNGEQYLEFEDWQTVGKFYGVTAKVVSTTPVMMGDVKGFEARAVAIHVKTGRELSAADSMCLSDEENWGFRPKYEWRNKQGGGGKEKVQVGETPVPLFQLRSMAQTRACAKVLRNVLAWVVVLAGYKPTPAEEMTDTRVVPTGGNKQQQNTGSEKKANAIDPESLISPQHLKHLQGLIDKSGVPEKEVLKKFNIPELSKLKFGQINEAIAFITMPYDPGDDEGREG